MAKKKVMTKKSSKEVAIKTEELVEKNLSSNVLAELANYDTSNFEGVELDITENKELFNNDIIVPKLWLMQEMSELAKDKSRKDIESGDYIDSQSEEVVLKVDDEKGMIPVIVIKTFKRWQTFQLTEKKKPLDRKKFISSEILTLQNHNLSYEFTDENGEEFNRRQVISAYVLKGIDAQMGIIKPYIIDFAATSKGGGRAMVSDIKVLNARELPSYVGWFKLGQKEEVNKDGDEYFVKTMKFGGLLPEKMMPFLKEAYVDITAMIDANVIEIDDRDVHEAAKQTNKKNANVTKEAIATDAGI